MKKTIFLSLLLVTLFGFSAVSQSIIVKDGSYNIQLRINDDIVKNNNYDIIGRINGNIIKDGGYNIICRIDSNTIKDGNYNIIGRIDGNTIKDDNYNVVGRIDGNIIKDGNYNIVGRINGSPRNKQMISILYFLVLWYFVPYTLEKNGIIGKTWKLNKWPYYDFDDYTNK